MHAYKGTWFYEAQVGALVMQVRHSGEVDGPFVRLWHDPMWWHASRLRAWLRARLAVNEELGWEYVATHSRTEPTLGMRLRFRLLCAEQTFLRAITEGGSLSWR